MRFAKIKSISICTFFFSALICISCVYTQNIQYVNPLPGAEYVSPKTNIIIRPGELLDASSIKNKTLLLISGSISGDHAGIIDIADDGKTILFQPDIEFSLGEVVTVSLLHGLKTKSTKSLKPFTFTFTITSRSIGIGKSSHSSFPDMLLLHPSEKNVMQSPSTQLPFRKLSDNFPSDFPQFKVTVNNNPSPGDFFFANNPLPGAGSYLAILKDPQTPLFTRRRNNVQFDFKMQPNGLLTYYPFLPNYFYALDSTYAIVDSFMCGNGYSTDCHDIQLLSNGYALLMASDEEQIDMSQMVEDGHPDASVTGLIIQEIDAQKRVVFEWRSWDHFKITDALGVDFKQRGIIYVWGNSLELDLDGNILLSSRVMCEITKIDRQTGDIIWRFGGKNNQFTFNNDTIGFSYQHDARRLPNGNITLLDNGNLRSPSFSRALEYQLDESAKTATLVWQYRNTPDIFSDITGNVQRLPNGNTLICWGNAHPSITEIHPDGSKAFEFDFIQDFMSTYRAFKFPWKTKMTSVQETPIRYALEQNYPNPVYRSSQTNTFTSIQYSLSQREHVQLKIYNILGQEISTLVDDVQDMGQHVATFEGNHILNGVYFYRIITPTFTQTKSMIVRN